MAEGSGELPPWGLDPKAEERTREMMGRIRKALPQVSDTDVDSYIAKHKEGTDLDHGLNSFDVLLKISLLPDLERALAAHSVYAPLITMCVYMESLGGSFRGRLLARGQGQENFDFFVSEFMPAHYGHLERKLKERDYGGPTGLYKMFRSGFVHGFGAQGRISEQVGYHIPENNWGVELRASQVAAECLCVSVKHLWGDFLIATGKLRARLEADPKAARRFTESMHLFASPKVPGGRDALRDRKRE